MTTTEMVAGRLVEIETVDIEPIRVRLLPDGRMDRNNAAKYINRAPKTLAIWAMDGKGPPVHKSGGRCFYYKDDLDAFIRGEVGARCRAPSSNETPPTQGGNRRGS